jgi:hypothetical protein
MVLKKIEFFLMRKITVKSVMDLIVNIRARLIGKIKLEDKESAFIKKENKEMHIRNLTEKGYTTLDNALDQDLVDRIIAYSEQINCFDTYNNADKPVLHTDPPPETHVAYYRRKDLVKFKPILDIANDPGILQVVQEFLGAKPTISNVNMWWSFGGRKQAEHAQLFHRDMDDWRFCKLFIYLTDVSEKSGPHIYVRNSSKSPKLRKIKRYKDSEIESTFGKENVLKFTGRKGTMFIVDTYGFHKGLLPDSEDRLLLQIQYSFYPIGIEKYEPVKIEQRENYNAYINRLLIK